MKRIIVILIFLLTTLFLIAQNDFEPANTSDTLAIYENGYVLHKLWTSTINKKVVSVVMSEPEEGVYRGFLYLKNIKEPIDILKQRSIDCQHLAGGYERIDDNGNGYLERVVYCSRNERGTIAKTWELPELQRTSKDEEKYDKRLYLIQHQYGLICYYKTSITFYNDGTGYQTFTVSPELIAPAAATSYNNGKTGFEYKGGESIRGGYKFTVNGTAKVKFKWEYNDDLLEITYDSNPSVTTNATMTDKFEKAYSENRQQHIAQAKQDIVTNPEVKEWKQKVADILKIIAQQGGYRLYLISFISNHTLRLIPMWVENDELIAGETPVDFFSKDAENLFVPDVEEFMKLLDPNTLIKYEIEK